MFRTLIISFISILLSLVSETYAQKKDTVYVRNFSTKDFKVSSINYTGLVDDHGILLFANENGVLLYDGSEWELITIVDFSTVYSLHKAPNGIIYVGGINEFGYLKPSAYSYEYISLRETVPPEKDIGIIWQIEDFEGSIYFASYEMIVRYEKNESHIININNSGVFKTNSEIFISRFDDGIYRIKEDSAYLYNDTYHWEDDNVYSSFPSLLDSSYLLYTSENGIYSFFPDENLIEPFKTSDDKVIKEGGLYDGQIWNDSLYVFSTWRDGFVMIDKQGEIVYRITAKNGLLTDSYQDFILDSRNNIWSTSTNGISYIQWQGETQKNEFQAITYITKVNADFISEYEIRTLDYHFATPGYDKSDLEYSFYLEGYDDSFGPWTNDVKKEYTNLDGGEYRFHVKAKLPSGEETAEALSERLSVPTPWYSQPIFYVGIIILITVIILALFRYRTYRLTELNRRLEKIINNRTQELLLQREQLREANEELTTTNTELDNFVYRSSHDLVAPLKSLKGLINLAEKETGDKVQLEYLKMMNLSVVKLEDFIKSIMEYSVNSKREILKEEIRLDDIIEGIKDDLQYFDNSERVELIKNYDTDLLLKSDKSRLTIVLSNLITNCIKYHNYGQEKPIIEVNVDADYTKGNTTIEVKDNGSGIDEQHLSKIFDMFFRASAEKNQGSGLGLYIVKDTVEKIGGHIDVDSEIGIGTSFKVVLYDTLEESLKPEAVFNT